LQSIRDYLREHHPGFAHSTIRRLYDAVRSLRQSPRRGGVGNAENTRELVMAPLPSLPYIIVYRVDSEFVHIFRVIHGAEDR
jgi:plasmid stabilization system protein ParE